MASLFNPRVLVCGGRNFNDQARMNRELDRWRAHYGDFALLIHGGQRSRVAGSLICHGADWQAKVWAHSHLVPEVEMAANWTYHVPMREAGFARNQMILDLLFPDIGIAFPGGAGTTDMVERLRRKNIPVLEVEV